VTVWWWWERYRWQWWWWDMWQYGDDGRDTGDSVDDGTCDSMVMMGEIQVTVVMMGQVTVWWWWDTWQYGDDGRDTGDSGDNGRDTVEQWDRWQWWWWDRWAYMIVFTLVFFGFISMPYFLPTRPTTYLEWNYIAQGFNVICGVMHGGILSYAIKPSRLCENFLILLL